MATGDSAGEDDNKPQACQSATGLEMYAAIREALGDGGADLEIPPREPIRDLHLFDE